MREIKFRAWDVWDKKIIDWREIYYNKAFNYDFHMGVTGNLIPMQYTGLKDKNGKEIYEGDIICNNNANWEVGFDEGGYWMRQQKGQHKFIFINEAQHSEVLSNIYENPELLDRVEKVEEIPVMEGTQEALDKIVI